MLRGLEPTSRRLGPSLALNLPRPPSSTPQEWMLSGQAERKPKFLSGRSAVVWSRHYSAHDNDRCDCEQLAEVLGRIPGAQRMVRGRGG